MTPDRSVDRGTGTLQVRVSTAPNPHLLRAAIEAVLDGRSWAPGPEADVADAVARRVAAAAEATKGNSPWR